MATRFYFEGNGTDQWPLTPSSWSAGWNTTTGQTRLLTHSSRKRSGSATPSVNGNSVSGNFQSVWRGISHPLKAQTISGTIKGQIRCRQGVATGDYTLAIAVKIVRPDGTDRAVLLAVTASDLPTSHEMATTLTNRSFRDASENLNISLTSQSASEGDVLVVEIGFRNGAGSNTTGEIEVRTDSGTDLSEDDSSTTANNSWIEFSGDISMQPIYWFASAATPEDNGSGVEPATHVITPPSGMVTGDLVIIGGVGGGTTANVISQSELGGQSWTALLDDTGTGSNNMQGAWWFCEFDGTWDASPSIAVAALSGSVASGAMMHVFRGATAWAVDVAMTKQAFAASTTPSITAQNPVANDTISFAAWTVRIANTWSAVGGAGWNVLGTSQYRNTGGSDCSTAFAYIYVADGATPANVTRTQSASNAGLSFIGTVKGTVPATSHTREPPSGNIALSAVAPDRVVASLREVPSGNVALSAVAPSVVQSAFREPPSANLAFSAVAPDVARTQNVATDVPSANLALSAVAPTVSVNYELTPPSSNLSLTAVAPDVQATQNTFIEVPQANLVLSTSSPVLQTAETISPPSANLTLSAVAPGVSGGLIIEPPSADLTLSAVSIAGSVIISWAEFEGAAAPIEVPSGNLLLSGSPPSLASNTSAEPPSTDLTLTTSAPTVALTAGGDVPSADLTLSAFAPTVVSTDHHSISVPSTNLVLSAVAPNVAWTDNRAIEVPSANLTLSTSAPDTSVTSGTAVPAADLSLSTSAPVVVWTDHRSITVPSANLTLSQVAPDIISGTVREPLSGGLALSQSAPVVQRADTISPATGDLALSSFAPTVNEAAHKDVPAGNLALTGSVPTVAWTDHRAIAVPSADLTLSTSAPDPRVTSGTDVPTGDIALTTSAPTVVWTDHRTISVPSGNLALSQSAPEPVQSSLRQPPSANLALSQFAPIIQRADTITPPSADLTLSSVAPLVAVSLQPPSANLTFSGFAPSVDLTVGSPVPSADLTFSASAPTVVWTDHRSISVPSANLTFSFVAPLVATSIQPPSANLALSGSPPTVQQTAAKEVPSANLALSGFAPTVVWTNNRAIEPPSANLVLTRSAPTVTPSVNWSVQVPSANLSLSQSAPEPDVTLLRDPPAAQLAFETFAPVLDVTGAVFVTPAAGNLLFTAAAPLVEIVRKKATAKRPGGTQREMASRSNAQRPLAQRSNVQNTMRSRYNIQNPNRLKG